MSDIGNVNFQLPESGYSQPPQDTSPPVGTESSPDSELVTDYLKGIPEQDRAIVQKYVKQWDAGVTKQFQKRAEELKAYDPYKQFVENKIPADQLQRAWQIAIAMDADPHAFYEEYGQALQQYANPNGEQPVSNEDVEIDGGDELPDFSSLPEDVQRYIENMSGKYQQLEGRWTEFEQRQAEAEAEAAFDNIIDMLHTKYGEFDMDYVLAQLAKGVHPDQAVQNYQKFVEGIVGSHKSKPAAPRIPGGQGGVPNDQVDLTKLTGRDRRNAVIQYLESAQG